eukprot:2903199-Rhodomonas_salina.1
MRSRDLSEQLVLLLEHLLPGRAVSSGHTALSLPSSLTHDSLPCLTREMLLVLSISCAGNANAQQCVSRGLISQFNGRSRGEQQSRTFIIHAEIASSSVGTCERTPTDNTPPTHHITTHPHRHSSTTQTHTHTPRNTTPHTRAQHQVLHRKCRCVPRRLAPSARRSLAPPLLRLA